ncbi:uncharacterized protein LOC112047658 [Bicyclus anynana]|uniref:Uncharacterized protein LOC112047658 n=1 Tax=Bicyclus anynana TaxID=110368 RepID=A0A6J1N184_BICAN|nr:uncharacterized protein LOC112047658 [Bicyclus anynana]
MNIPHIKCYEEQAVDAVVGILNRAREMLGERQTLKQLAISRDALSPPAKVALTSLKCPLAITSEELIKNTIEKKWKLTENLMYILKYMGISKDEGAVYYYFEAVFSQPTAAYPIPQATASVFFTLQDKQVEPPEVRGVPKMMFRIEGQVTDHDIRYVTLVADWILSVLQMKIKLFRRIESLLMF